MKERVLGWLGLPFKPTSVRRISAKRNMYVVAIAGGLMALYALMLSLCLVTGAEYINATFLERAHATPASLARFTITSFCMFVVLAACSLFAFMWLRRQGTSLRFTTVVTVVFSLATVATMGYVQLGASTEHQILIFSSLQYLIAGLIVFNPVVALGYFTASFVLFGGSLAAYGLLEGGFIVDLAYLWLVAMVVSWTLYSVQRAAARHEDEVVDRSRRDELTGAKNRAALRDELPTLFGTNVFVMLCDIDNFKHYNDTFSHDTGDAMLKSFFFALREAFGDESTYRYGGDEFLIMSSDFDEEEFCVRAHKVTEQLQRVIIAGHNANLTYSGGYCWGTIGTGEDFRRMLHTADARLLESKRAGKNRIVGVPDGSSEKGNVA